MTFTALTNLVILAAESTPSTTPQGSGLSSLMFPMLLMFGLMYFLILRPNNQRRRQMAEMLGRLKVGDQVIMMSGIHGIVANKNDAKATVTVKVAEGVKIKFEKAAVERVIPKGEAVASDTDDGDNEADDEEADDEAKLRSNGS